MNEFTKNDLKEQILRYCSLNGISTRKLRIIDLIKRLDSNTGIFKSSRDKNGEESK